MDDKDESDEVADAIAVNLQRAFLSRAEEDVPDRFMSLLEALRDQDGVSEEESLHEE